MNRFLGLVIALAVVMTPLPGHAASLQRGPYSSIFIGATIPRSQDVNSTDYYYYPARNYSERIELDPGISVGVTGGYDFGYVRLEGEFSYKYAEIKALSNRQTGYRYAAVDGNVGALAVMFNTFADLHNRSRVTPYIGGGIGFASLHLSDTYGDGSHLYYDDYDSVFAYQVGTGMEIALNRQLSLDIGYRYFGTDTARVGTNNYSGLVTNLKFEAHNATVGVRFKF